MASIFYISSTMPVYGSQVPRFYCKEDNTNDPQQSIGFALFSYSIMLHPSTGISHHFFNFINANL
ncbi:hypothetical protein DICPUDRAFT_158175 [Dictyostelium purpureum]|uniref:Uncharacterized protein n=1 Tax=Dictyostelium purpureum TaxID=5786 RepID=F1A106_DICPU|nr:uncharacterized protein DICPUDRAFT_158175 [Dictyostelium purpureum]EGC30116.1 hypothetical protein DICPUDRAFT_158175 [Dictyostelium purpureum]|eukprot:XP_003293348.1 hypothetical protein DICPUDRAFT_158175 [Dictyostelium purpureum]